MTNPREQAIERIETIITKTIKYDGWGGFCNKKEVAEAILDALNVEVVSKESELLDADLVDVHWYKRDTEELIGISYGIYDAESNTVENDGEDVGCGYEGKESFDIIIQRNNKPAVYVENIGVKL